MVKVKKGYISPKEWWSEDHSEQGKQPEVLGNSLKKLQQKVLHSVVEQ